MANNDITINGKILLDEAYVVMGQDPQTNQAWVAKDTHGDEIFTLDHAHAVATDRLKRSMWGEGCTYKVFKLVPWVEADAEKSPRSVVLGEREHITVTEHETDDGEIRYLMANTLMGENVEGQFYNGHDGPTHTGVDLATAETILSDWLDIDEPAAFEILGNMSKEG
jgi:hypothetical protein